MKEILLTDVCRPKQWKTISMQEMKSSGYPVFGANGIIGYYDKYTHEKPTLLITCRGATCGTMNISLPFSYVNGNAMALDNLDSEKVDLKFLFYYLKNRSLRDTITGTAQPQITRESLKKVKILLPPLREQKRIAEVLDKADALREKRRLALQKLDTLLQSVFLEMFGDPVKNPKGWEDKKIDDVVLVVSSGSTPLGGSSTYVSEGKTFIRSQNVLMNSFDFSDVAFITDETHKQMKRTWVKNGDVLFNITGASIGRVHYFSGEDDSANVNQHVCIIRPNQKIIRTEFLSFFLSIPSYQTNIFGKNAGATRQAFNFQQIRSFNIFLPPISEQNKFVDFYNKVQKLRIKQAKAKNESENLFQSLQQRAFKGELFNDEFPPVEPQEEKVWQQTSLF